MDANKDTRRTAVEEPWTIGRLLQWTTEFLQKKGSVTPGLDTEVLTAHALGCKRIELYTRYENVATTDERQRLRELIRQRTEGCPVAYLVGRKEFFTLEFEVSPAVLIPRPDSEWVVYECLRVLADVKQPEILDLGTGSGNLAVAVARQHKSARVTAVDISDIALAVAIRNAQKHDVLDRVTFLEGDLFAPLSGEARFDVVLSNPPYIPRGEIAQLSPGVRDHEPHLALDGGDDGFEVFDRIVRQAQSHLKPDGHLILEIGSPQEEPARQRISAVPGYELANTIYDGSGHPRVLRARRVAG